MERPPIGRHLRREHRNGARQDEKSEWEGRKREGAAWEGQAPEREYREQDTNERQKPA
jgi:hypothetical protein